MIIIRLKGGLGNQMFIYALGKALALKTGQKLQIDKRTGFIRDKYKRAFKLNAFAISAGTCNIANSIFFWIKSKFPFLLKIYGNHKFIEERNNKAYGEIELETATKNYYVEGLWQSPKYFSEFENELRKEFIFKIEFNNKLKDIQQQLTNTSSVAVHFRRIQYQPLLPLAYYQKAVDEINSKVKDACFYVFSDDMHWVKENFTIPKNIIFVDVNRGNELTDMYLMSQCNHHIISNSTFAWWGAWLSNYKEKIVIAPKVENWYAKDILNENWTVID